MVKEENINIWRNICTSLDAHEPRHVVCRQREPKVPERPARPAAAGRARNPHICHIHMTDTNRHAGRHGAPSGQAG
eukprot:2123271-Prymnesium_polylepis.2